MNQSIQYIRLQSEDRLPVIEPAQPFKAIVVIEEAVSEIWRWDVCRWLVQSGCRFMMAWGPECESWVESLDEASLEAANYEEIPQESLIQATSHEDEELSDVFWFARHKVHHPAHDLRHTVILHISPQDKHTEFEAALNHA